MHRGFLQLGLLLGLYLTLLGEARADTFLVQVQSNYFSPNDLTIEPGDTVRWRLSPPPEDGCDYYCPPGGETTHTVTADDGSFSSGEPSSEFVFEHMFESPGEFRYYCQVHSEPGRDILQFMNGRVVVESVAGEVFQINAGLNDAWYDPATAGQGMFITVFPDIQRIFFAWFTFDTERPPPDLVAVVGEPGHRWLTAFGPYNGDTAMLDVELTSGGLFVAAEPMPTSTADGTVMIEFSGCNAAMVNFDLTAADLQGQIPIQRLANDNVALCEALSAR